MGSQSYPLPSDIQAQWEKSLENFLHFKDSHQNQEFLLQVNDTQRHLLASSISDTLPGNSISFFFTKLIPTIC